VRTVSSVTFYGTRRLITVLLTMCVTIYCRRIKILSQYIFIYQRSLKMAIRNTRNKSPKYIYLYIIFLALQPSAVYSLLVTRGFLITHNDAPQSEGLLLDE
jgi:ADP-glucose pyrophosphorylase